MDIKRPYLFLEVNDNQFVFLVVKYSEDLSFDAAIESYETLGSPSSDRYEYILPSYGFNKNIDAYEEYLNGWKRFLNNG